MSVAMGGPAMGVRGSEFDTDQIQHTVTNSALGDDFLGKCTHAFDRTLEHDGLDALVMIEVRVHGGDRQVVVRVLDARQPLRRLAFVMIVNIRQIGDARSLEVALLSASLQVRTQHVAHRFAAVPIAAFPHEFIERRRQICIE